MKEQLDFKVENIKSVPIEQVKTNEYNPKEKRGEKYQKVLASISLNGLMSPIFVREIGKDSYEIIDGEQRFTACQDLAFKNVMIYNYGQIDDIRARELTIWWQEQVAFDEIKLAELFTDLVNKVAGDYTKLELPFTDKEIEDKIEMLKFDWTQFEKEKEEIEKDKHEEAVKCPHYGEHRCYYHKTGEKNELADEEFKEDLDDLPISQD